MISPQSDWRTNGRPGRPGAFLVASINPWVVLAAVLESIVAAFCPLLDTVDVGVFSDVQIWMGFEFEHPCFPRSLLLINLVGAVKCIGIFPWGAPPDPIAEQPLGCGVLRGRIMGSSVFSSLGKSGQSPPASLFLSPHSSASVASAASGVSGHVLRWPLTMIGPDRPVHPISLATSDPRLQPVGSLLD